MKCAFCDNSADVDTCDFAVWDFVRGTYAGLKEGDKVRRIVDRLPKAAATVVSVQDVFGLGGHPGVNGVTIILRKGNGKRDRADCLQETAPGSWPSRGGARTEIVDPERLFAPIAPANRQYRSLGAR